MDKHSNAASGRTRRSSGLVLNPVQVGLAVGFVAVALLIVFGLGVIIGMWYQASGHISTHADAMPAAEERPATTPDPGHPDVTFYSTLTASEPTSASLPPLPAVPGAVEPAPLPPTPRDAEPRDAEPVVDRAALPPTPTAPVPPAPPVAPFFSVQVGSFRAAEQAETLRQHLLRKGYDEVRVQLSMVPGQGPWYRVRVGHFSARAAAAGLASRLHAQERLPVMVAVETPAP